MKVEEPFEMLDNIDMKKRLIDGLEETHLPIHFEGFGKKEWLMMKEFEETFYFPPEKYTDDFQIWDLGPLGYLRWTGISKEDGTKVTGLWVIKQIFPFLTPITFFIKKSPNLKKRLDFVIKKHGAKFKSALEGPNKNFFKSKKNNKRNPLDSKLRHECFKRDNYKCLECGATNEEKTLHADHIHPVSQGGTDELSNLQTLCDDCNFAKYNRKWKAKEKLKNE